MVSATPKFVAYCPYSFVRHRRTAYEPNAKYPPEQFIPERFLDPDCPSVEPAVYAFGYGRRCAAFSACLSPAADAGLPRICPGKALADASVFTLATTLLATYNIAQSPDAPLVPEYYEAQLTRYDTACALLDCCSCAHTVVRNASSASSRCARTRRSRWCLRERRWR